MQSLSVCLGSTFLLATLAACGGNTASSSANNAAPSGDDSTSTTGDDAGASQTTADAGASAQDAAPVVSNGAPSTTYPAVKPDVPQVVSSGGPVLTSPKVMPIFYPGYALEDQVVDFTNTVGATDYWSANVSEYGVGALVGQPKVDLTDAAPTTIADADIQTWLASMLDGTHPEFGTPDSHTIYAIFYPATTTITTQAGPGSTGQSCQDFGGYHDSITVGTQDYAYAVIPQCDGFGGLNGIDDVTGAASHELIEASTDPYPTTSPAYSGVDDNHLVWELALGGGEIGDLCAQFSGVFYKPASYNYTVQRTWSNKQAAAGHDPCAPALGNTVYFNSMPVLADKVALGGKGAGGFTTKGVAIATGSSKTVEVDLFSDSATTGEWTVQGVDALQAFGYSTTSSLAFSWDKNRGVNGEKLHLTIDSKKASAYGGSPFIIISTLNQTQNMWVGMVAPPSASN